MTVDKTTGTAHGFPYLFDRATLRAELGAIERVPGVPKPDPILSVDNMEREFGGLKAVDVAHLEVQRGAITALIGPNGAGKTTFFNLITGFDKPSPSHSGPTRWNFNGKSLRHTGAATVSRMGMVRTFQLTKVLSRMTVLDNMMLGAQDQRGEGFFVSFVRPAWIAKDREIRSRALDLLQRFRLYEKRDDYAGSLSGGQRKLLEMARSLMSSPSLIMLDEPMAGVNPALTQSLLDHIQELRDDGTTVLFVEHDMHMVRFISDWVVVMAEGKVVAEAPPKEVMNDPAVVDAYLGAHHDTDLGDDALLEEGESLDALVAKGAGSTRRRGRTAVQRDSRKDA